MTSHLSSETLGSSHSPFTSVILRDSSIREQSTASSLEDNLSANAGGNTLKCSNRYGNMYNNVPQHINPASIQMSSRDSTSSIYRDPSAHSSFTGSNRFLIGGLDQRIIKQSSEDCRRLLQQVNFYLKFINLFPSLISKTFIQAIAVVDPRVQQVIVHQEAARTFIPNHTPQRQLSASSSFDLKPNVTNFCPFNMSAEAARLFQTLQQSPLPVAQPDVINTF